MLVSMVTRVHLSLLRWHTQSIVKSTQPRCVEELKAWVLLEINLEKYF